MKRLPYCLYLLLVASSPIAAEVDIAPKPPRIDGGLREWGAAEHLSVVAGGERVILRGSFEGESDHEADIYLMWDAESLYVAALVRDDAVDVSRVAPTERVWESGALRKDKMFYYDHFRVYLQDPDKPLGFDLWMAPRSGQSEPYLWGGRQRHPGSSAVPVRAGSMGKAGIYTFELAIPWSWLEIFPQPEMELEAMFLLTDADQPGVEMEEKVRQPTSHILWRGKILLSGSPPGLKPPPISVVERIEEGVKEREIPVIRREIAKSTGPETELNKRVGGEVEEVGGQIADAAKNGIDSAESPAGREGAAIASGDSAPPPSNQMQVLTELAALNRKLLGKKKSAVPPAWLADLATEEDLSRAQRDSLFLGVAGALYRLIDRHINGRTDMLVVDMANYARTRRGPVRAFFQALLQRVSDEVQTADSPVRTRLIAQANDLGIAEERAVLLVVTLCAEAQQSYRKGEITTTDALLKKAVRKAKLSTPDASKLVRAFLADWRYQ